MLADLIAAGANVDESLPFLKWITAASGTAVAGGCVWLVYTGRLILRREFDTLKQDSTDDIAEIKQDRDEWKALALRLLGQNATLSKTSERAVGAAEQAVNTAAKIVGDK